MKRWLVNILAALSLLLCLATAVMWVRSYWVGEWVAWYSALEEVPATVYKLHASSADGVFELALGRTAYPPLGDVYKDSRPYYLERIEAERAAGWHYVSRASIRGNRHGFHFQHVRPYGRWGMVTDWWVIILPYWFLLALTALLPGFVGWRRWRAAVRRRRVGVCAVCGYDLRATVRSAAGQAEGRDEGGGGAGAFAVDRGRRRSQRVLPPVKILELQPSGKKPCPLKAYRHGRQWDAGMRLISAEVPGSK